MADTRFLLTASAPRPAALLELVKPITWFAPIWALACGAVAGAPAGKSFAWLSVAAGMVLAGPLVCGASQAANDWFDRDVDAINEPGRPIPSGRVPGRWGLGVAISISLAALAFAALLGDGVVGATVIALGIGWAYSAPPFRLKREGWTGAAATGVSYEGIAWLTGALIVGGPPVLSEPLMVPVALLYSVGALGIMVLNDFKAVDGDRTTGIRSLPARYGVDRAARIACVAMALPQVLVVIALDINGRGLAGSAVFALVFGQVLAMRRLLRDPRRYAPWYNAVGVLMYVAGMMVTAVALQGWEAG